MAYVGSYLEKNAYTWFSSYVNKDTGAIDFETLNILLEKLKRGFADPDELATANRDIRKLKQTKSVAAYFSEFTRLANILDLNEKARRYQFEEGLSDEVKDALSVHPKQPDVFEDYVDEVSAIDNRLYARRESKRTHTSKSTTTTTPGSTSSKNCGNSNHHNPTFGCNRHSPWTHGHICWRWTHW